MAYEVIRNVRCFVKERGWLGGLRVLGGAMGRGAEPVGRLHATAERWQRAAAVEGAKRLEREAARLRQEAAEGHLFPGVRNHHIERARSLEARANAARQQLARAGGASS